jgi:hypothetical protein
MDEDFFLKRRLIVDGHPYHLDELRWNIRIEAAKNGLDSPVTF